MASVSLALEVKSNAASAACTAYYSACPCIFIATGSLLHYEIIGGQVNFITIISMLNLVVRMLQVMRVRYLPNLYWKDRLEPKSLLR